MFGQAIEIKLTVQLSGHISIEGPDLVAGRPVWDYVLNELQREITKRLAKAQESRIVPPTMSVMPHGS